MTKTLRVKKPDFCDNTADKLLIFKCTVSQDSISAVKGFLEFKCVDGSRKKIELDMLEVQDYQNRFWREFEELIATTKKQLTRRCVFV